MRGPSVPGVTLLLQGLCIDAASPEGLSRFWSGVLGREVGGDGLTLLPNDAAQWTIEFRPTTAEKWGQNQIHFDLTSASDEQMQQTVARALELGGRHIDVGQRPEEGHVVLADPEGNEFCIIPPGNNFLAGTAFVGAINCDGSQQVGYYWSKALDWPLVLR